MKRCPRVNFKIRKDLGSYMVSHQRLVVVLNLLGNFLVLGTDSVGSLHSIQSPQPSKLGTSPSSSAFKGRTDETISYKDLWYTTSLLLVWTDETC